MISAQEARIEQTRKNTEKTELYLKNFDKLLKEMEDKLGYKVNYSLIDKNFHVEW